MSFSPFEDFLELPSDSENSSTDDEQSRRSHDEVLYETTILSSRGSESALSFNDTMSFSSDTLQDFGSIVTLPPGTLAGLLQRYHDENSEDTEEHTMSTIVSSAPSGSYIPVPEASQDVWAISPHPRFEPGGVQELSTVCTDTLSYQRFLEDTASVISAMEHEDTKSSASIHRTLTRSSTHERAAFEAIANQLLRDVSGHKPSSGAWYSRFTEFDWDQLREVAKVVVAATGPPIKLLPLPPSPSINALPESAQHLMESYCTLELIPSNFVCPCCKDVLVGALALACGCTVCTACCDVDDVVPSEMPEQEGYIWIGRRLCPSCHRPVESSVPCHALDMAILHILETLDTSRQNSKTQSMMIAYYSRLEIWRQTVIARNETRLRQQALNEDEMLARLIEEEEEILWQNGKAGRSALPISTQALLFLGQAAVAVLAATFSSFALHAFARRR